jgi:hypothetical protein
MSYNEEVETFVKGDLVYFVGYELDNPPLAHKVGIVVRDDHVGHAHTTYEVYWLYSGTTISVAGKHLTLAYTRE